MFHRFTNAEEEPETDRAVLIDTQQEFIFFQGQNHTDLSGHDLFDYFEKYCLDYLMMLENLYVCFVKHDNDEKNV